MIGNYKVKESFGNIEASEIFLDTLAHQKEEEIGISEKKFEVKIKEKIIYVIFGLFFVVALTFSLKTFYWQIFLGNELSILADNNKVKIGLVRPERGIIYDASFKKLVSNAPAYDIICDKRNFVANQSEYQKEISILAPIVGKSYGELENQIAFSESSDILVAENIKHETLLVLEAKMSELPDCLIEKNTARNYATSPIFSHILGYTGKVSRDDLKSFKNYSIADYIGKTGVEKYYEAVLRGKPGQVEVIRNAYGIKKGDKLISDPKEGYNLVLNIDANLQKKVYESLEKAIKNVNSKKGAAVALDPQTGSVLAMVSYPAYDNNIFSQGILQADFNTILQDQNQPFFNRAIAAQYPTGSTIKPFIASAALQERLIYPHKKIYDPGYILIQSKYDPSVTYRFGGVQPHGLVDMREAIAVSSNIYFYTVGGGYEDQQGLGPLRIKKYLDLFGWGEKTGIDLPGEFQGFVPDPEWKKRTKNEQWWDGDTYNLSIGQSDLQVTPLQVAVAYAAIANGGTLYKPQIVQKIIDGSGESATVVREFQPEIINQGFINPENLQVVREGMRDGVKYGSSVILNTLPFSVAGKTGTAETNRAGYFNTWSSNFAPYDNPEIVFVATIEGVEGLRSATLPVAHEVLQHYFGQK